MTAVSFVAMEGLQGGHIGGETVTLNLSCISLTPRYSRRKEVSESLNGNREVLRYHKAIGYRVELAPAAGAPLAQIIEFLESCADGQLFQFDPYGSANTPHLPVTAELDIDEYELPRWLQFGRGGADDLHTVHFAVRVLVS